MKVQERGLTKAYAQEVRPFIRRGLLSPTFGRRGKKAVDEKFEQAKAEVADLMQKAEDAAKADEPKKRPARRSRAKKAAPVEVA